MRKHADRRANLGWGEAPLVFCRAAGPSVALPSELESRDDRALPGLAELNARKRCVDVAEAARIQTRRGVLRLRGQKSVCRRVVVISPVEDIGEFHSKIQAVAFLVVEGPSEVNAFL